MNRLLYVLISMALITPNAFASKARLQALGQGENGSYYIDDPRMIFLNPALIHKQKDFANFELGSSTVPSTPNAEGGFFRAEGANKYGAQLGRESTAAAGVATINATFGTDLIAPQNTIEVIMASGADMGFSAMYGSATDNAEITPPATTAFPNKKAQTLELRGGVDKGEWNGYVDLVLIAAADTEQAGGTEKFEGKPSLVAGGTKNLDNNQKVFGQLTYLNFAGKTAAMSSTLDVTSQGIAAGWVQFVPVEASSKFFYSGGLTILNNKVAAAPGGTDTKNEFMFVPVVVGLENDVNDWLTLRASVTQNVLIDQHKTTVTDTHNPNTTTVAAGTGFRFKKLTLDTTLEGSTTGKVNGTTLLANAGLTYMF